MAASSGPMMNKWTDAAADHQSWLLVRKLTDKCFSVSVWFQDRGYWGFTQPAGVKGQIVSAHGKLPDQRRVSRSARSE